MNNENNGNNETTGIPLQNINRDLEGEQTTLLYGDTIAFRWAILF